MKRSGRKFSPNYESYLRIHRAIRSMHNNLQFEFYATTRAYSIQTSVFAKVISGIYMISVLVEKLVQLGT